MEELYNLDLHEMIMVGETMRVTRVPGGWIYATYSHGNVATSFVPFVAYDGPIKDVK